MTRENVTKFVSVFEVPPQNEVHRCLIMCGCPEPWMNLRLCMHIKLALRFNSCRLVLKVLRFIMTNANAFETVKEVRACIVTTNYTENHHTPIMLSFYIWPCM